MITVDALHFQRDHVTYLAERGADWMLTVKGNQPTLPQQLAGLPWRAVPDVTREAGRGHGRRQIRTLKILTVSTGIDFPRAAQAIRCRRRRHRWDQPSFTTETAATGPSRTRSTGSAMSLTTKTAPKSAPAPDHKSWPCLLGALIAAYGGPLLQAEALDRVAGMLVLSAARVDRLAKGKWP